MLLHVHKLSNDTFVVSVLQERFLEDGVMTKRIIGEAIICSTNHFTMTIWTVFQQCNFQISLSIHISLSLILVHHTKLSKSTDEIRAADVEIHSKNVKEKFMCKQ